jgi:uncharacterized DUF497 family protein
MTDDEITMLFDGIRRVAFDPVKRERILKERQVDLEDMRFVLGGDYVIRRSDRRGEQRFMVFGFLDDVEVTFVCTIRGDLCHVITARRAKRNERKRYHDRIPGRSAPGQD